MIFTSPCCQTATLRRTARLDTSQKQTAIMNLMPTLPLSPDELLTTTRTVRKRLDLTRPVPLDLVRECLEVALQAPSGSNRQGWHWMVITDENSRRVIGDYYRQSVASYLNSSGVGRGAVSQTIRSAARCSDEWGTASPISASTWVRCRCWSFPASVRRA